MDGEAASMTTATARVIEPPDEFLGLGPDEILEIRLKRHLEDWRQLLDADPELTEAERTEMLETERINELAFVEFIFKKLQAIGEAKPRPVAAGRKVWIDVFGDGSWCRSEGPAGLLAQLLPVIDPASGQPFDCVAWAPARPNRWWRQRLLADVLGEADLRSVWWDQRPITLCSTPAEWVRTPSPRACVLDWRCDLHRALWRASTIVCTKELAERLGRVLAEQVRPRFSIKVRR
jgi:hypothetical protein